MPDLPRRCRRVAETMEPVTHANCIVRLEQSGALFKVSVSVATIPFMGSPKECKLGM
jgi:hypothetical protein